jgi:hypothetical protein
MNIEKWQHSFHPIQKIYESLISNGVYIECDYFAINQLEENFNLYNFTLKTIFKNISYIIMTRH